jgi:hypothetical protein
VRRTFAIPQSHFYRERTNVSSLGIDHVSYALFDFSLSFLIYLLITFLVHLYASTGKNAAASTSAVREVDSVAGYSKLDPEGGAESFELAEQESGDEDAVKIGTGDEVDWLDGRERAGGGVSRVRL